MLPAMAILSRHAAARSSQRAISPMAIDLLMRFGTSVPAGPGTEKIFFDKRARRQVRAYAGPAASALAGHLDIYAVVSGSGTLITIAHREARIRRV